MSEHTFSNQKSFGIVDMPEAPKEEGDLGIVKAFVSVFENIDYAKERVMPGAFKDSLATKLPKVVWMHKRDMPIGKTVVGKEMYKGDPNLPQELMANGGLYVEGHFNLETQRGKEAYSDLKHGIVDEFSFGYDVEDWKENTDFKCWDLLKLWIQEWSPVLVGCNPKTVLAEVKEKPLVKSNQLDAELISIARKNLWRSERNATGS